MKNELLLKQAIELLQEVNPDELETVRVDHTKYDDGSVDFTVELTYPSNDKPFESITTTMDGRAIGELAETYITEIQNRKQRTQENFKAE